MSNSPGKLIILNNDTDVEETARATQPYRSKSPTPIQIPDDTCHVCRVQTMEHKEPPKIRVVVRKRPLTQKEVRKGDQDTMKMKSASNLVV